MDEVTSFSARSNGHRLGIDHTQYELWGLETMLPHHQVQINNPIFINMKCIICTFNMCKTAIITKKKFSDTLLQTTDNKVMRATKVFRNLSLHS